MPGLKAFRFKQKADRLEDELPCAKVDQKS